ncbi:MAG: 2-C-methyl-D-erythritol 4-phosphate cytidylyltransferase, partial [Deinococcus sp.]|nr:2-C-methyl-D-erythritol 4-phosphate cytidylyltransferase [Deinococcus sp.]
TDADVVLIHDAARPFLPARVIRQVAAAAWQVGAATAALPVADTLVQAKAEPGEAQCGEAQWGTLTPREGLWAVQTPQGFRRAALLAAHESAYNEGHAATDDAGLIARLGQSVALIPGDARLFKVTTPGDLALAEAVAAVWDGKSAGQVE